MTTILLGHQLFDREDLTSFCQIFKDEVARLFSLALLLTADPVRAERCFISSLNDCSCFPPLEKERGSFWSKRFIIHNAIQMLRPDPEDKRAATVRGNAEFMKNPPELVCNLLRLTAFQRFVYVMSILDGLEDDEICSSLKCSLDDIAAARETALRGLLGFDIVRRVSAVAIRDQNGKHTGVNATI